MTTWYVKELSKITKVSVRTLHYYDKIGLLKPSGRLSNGYRVYSETDLLKLERVIALKFFGFTLSQIKVLMDRDFDALRHLRAQLTLLQAEASYLREVQKTLLTTVIHELESNNSINWHHIVQLIEVYAKTKELKTTWAGQAYSEEQLKQFAEFKKSDIDATDEEKLLTALARKNTLKENQSDS